MHPARRRLGVHRHVVGPEFLVRVKAPLLHAGTVAAAAPPGPGPRPGGTAAARVAQWW
ncbi:hypothetical protein SFR_6328 [Streptomyces sp. FR-008]|nr:hypothetical protein SFR_6328 [Streptomyces sp. FR-008]